MISIELEEIKELEQEINAVREKERPPQTMEELYRLLKLKGRAWREANKEEKEIKKGKHKGEVEIKIPIPKVADVVKVLLEHCHFTFIGFSQLTDVSNLYFFHLDLGYYLSSRDIINKMILTFDNRLTSKKFTDEVVMFLRAETSIQPPMQESYLIPVNNGIFNLKTKELEPFSPERIITTKIKTAYNPKARKPLLGGWFDFDEWFKSLANGDDEIIQLLWQVMNEAINPNRTRKKMVIMKGEGNNGKGTFQALLEEIIGRENISNLKPEQFQKEHVLSALNGKVCNIGDDISNKYLDTVSDLMSIVTGDTIQVNPKHSQPYEATYRLLCIFSGNDLPKSRNKSQGWYRRLCIVPFDADFNGTVERPEIKDNFIKDKDLLEWVLFKILNMPDFDRFIEPQAVKKMLDEYKIENDFYYSFIVTNYIPNGYHELAHVPLPIVKRWLEEYTEDEGIKNPNLYGFGSKVTGILNKEAQGTYAVKNGRVPLEERAKLDPLGFDSKKLNGTPKGIHKES